MTGNRQNANMTQSKVFITIPKLFLKHYGLNKLIVNTQNHCCKEFEILA